MKLKIYELDNIKDEVLKMTKYYIDQLPIPEKLKFMLFNESFFTENPAFYGYYPYLFVKNKDKNLDLLSTCGTLYYQSLILLDRILDKDIKIAEALPTFMLGQEESVRILQKMLGDNPCFWEKFQQRKLELFSAYTKERTCEIENIDDYKELASGKSAMAKIAIDALWALGYIDSTTYDRCLYLHKLFYVAFQTLDDISDMREDLNKSQFNVANWELSQFLGRDIQSEDISIFYTSACYEKLYSLVFDTLDMACSIAQQEELKWFLIEASKLWNTALVQKQNIKSYLYELSIDLSSTYSKSTDLDSSIHLAVTFVEKQQNKDGEWIDFCNNAGYSNIWSTAFITMILQESGIANSHIDKAKEFLKQYSIDQIGYSDIWIADNDSITMYSLATGDYSIIPVILSTQNSDGGFSTYFNKQELVCSLSNVKEQKDVEAWVQSHPCVSSAILYLCTKANAYNKKVQKCVDYFKNLFTLNRPLCYWWIDDIYTVFFISKANKYIKDRELDTIIRRKVQEKLHGKIEYESNVFYLSILLELCCEYSFVEEAQKLMHNIILLQYSDGSWAASDFLCVPGANNNNPTHPEKWKIGTHGVNIRISEFHRLFTTSMAILSLTHYKKINEKARL